MTFEAAAAWVAAQGDDAAAVDRWAAVLLPFVPAAGKPISQLTQISIPLLACRPLEPLELLTYLLDVVMQLVRKPCRVQ